MRLYLASQGMSHIDRLRTMTGGNNRMLLIDNAKDGMPPSARKAHVTEKLTECRNLGFDCTELDLREYFDGRDVRSKLEGIGLLWVSGGNCFVLRRALRQSKLDEVLKDELGKDSFVYGGSSAGSIMATPSLLGVEVADDPDELPDGYDSEIVWNGLGLIDRHIVPHFKSVWFDAESKKLVRALKEHGVPYITLSDGEALVVEGGSQELLR